MNYRTKKALWGYLFILPSIVGFLLFMIVPVGYALMLSFTKWDIISSFQFIGLGNYIALFQDARFHNSILRTLQFMSITFPLSISLSLLLACALAHTNAANKLYRALVFLPVITSMVSVALVWSMLLADDVGLVNVGLESLGLRGVGWLSDPGIAMYSVGIVSVWKGLGYNMTIYIAGLQGIPSALYEAAEIDGANAVRKFFHITIPMLRPTTYFICIIGVINSLQVFDSVYVMTECGPGNATETMVAYLYFNGFRYLKMGYAAAISYVLFLMIFVFSFLQNKVFGNMGDFRDK